MKLWQMPENEMKTGHLAGVTSAKASVAITRHWIDVACRLAAKPGLMAGHISEESSSMTRNFRRAALVVLVFLPLVVHAGDARREAEVVQLGADVMPFSLQGTTHVFTKTADGGTQRVVAKTAGDARQVGLVRAHLLDIQSQFLKGDFSGPMHVHGVDMPGLADLEAAKPGQIAIDYKDVGAGAELTYRTSDAKLVAALHRWFDAQLSDHGADALAGPMHHHDHDEMMKP